MKKHMLTFVAAVCLTVAANAQMGMGMVENPALHNTFRAKKPDAKGYGSEMPKAWSLMAYTPYVKSQGQYGTCASWSSTYSAYTTAWAIKMGMTDRNLITALSFCPYFVYNQVNGDANCSSGNSLEDVLVFMMDNGSKRFYMPVIGCGTGVTPEMTADASQYKINDAYILYDVQDFPQERTAAAVTKFLTTKAKPDIDAIKSAIASNNPVVFGGFVANSFMQAMGTDHWTPTYEERTNPGQAVLDNHGMHQLHAMTIIGYDDNKYGGAFQIMNSWSSLWGENGYIWVSYDDWALFNYKAFWLDIGLVRLEILTKEGCASGDCNNGYGVMKWNNGQRYEGHFVNGERSGYGIYTWPDGNAYAGQWKAGKREGEGVLYNPDGSYGTCMYANDVQVSGFGNWTYNNGDRYQGVLNTGYVRNGYGVYTFTDGRVYEGAFKDESFSGLGKMTWPNGDSYMGEWLDNNMHGYGIYTYANGKVKAGKWNFGLLGNGQSYGYAASDGHQANRIQGLFAAVDYATADCVTGDCLNGKGSKKYSSGLVYEGEFKDALEDGYGTWTFTDGSKQTGYFVQGTPAGVFSVTFSGGDKMIGENVKGKVNGYGLYISSSGTMTLEYYSDGTFIREVTPSSTTMQTQLTPEKFGEKPHTDLDVNQSK